MTCKECKAKDWVPTKQWSKDNPLENIGGVERYSTFVQRRYLCHNCGHTFYSKESYDRPLVPRKQLDLLDDGD